MQDLYFGRSLSVSCSGLLTTPHQADLVMLYRLVEKKEQEHWECFLTLTAAFDYFISLFCPWLISIDRIHSRELPVPEMDSMSSSVSSPLEMKDITIWKFSGQSQLERTACWALIILFPWLWSFSLKISFLVFSLKSEQMWCMPSASGRIIPSETSLICLCKCWR